MRIGIYGGTFDPPHNGHIAAAKAAMERLALDKLLLIPTFIPPHKALPAGAASPTQRHDMAVLATAELGKKAEVLDVELERGGPSYTWETLHLLRERYPEDELWLLMGSDMFLTLQDWREPRQVMALARIGAFSRLESGEEAAFARQKAFLEREYGADVTIIPNPQVVELSSTEARQTLAQGGGADILPTAVYGYILRERLYGTHRELTGLTPDELRRRAKDGTICEVLNRVAVHPGDVFFVRPGTVHAIGAGILVAEIQQNSDTTFRVYDYNRLGVDGKPRQLHLERAAEVMNYTPMPGAADTLPPCPPDGVQEVLTCEYFRVRRAEVKTRISLATDGESFTHLMCVRGEGSILCGGKAYPFRQGDSYFLPAALGEYAVEGDGSLVLSGV